VLKTLVAPMVIIGFNIIVIIVLFVLHQEDVLQHPKEILAYLIRRMLPPVEMHALLMLELVLVSMEPALGI
jgi:hypothetical protein